MNMVLTLVSPTYAPGDTVRGQVAVTEGGPSRELRVCLAYREIARNPFAKDQTATGQLITHEPLHTGDLTEGATFSFELELPQTALPNYQSRNGELYWEAQATADLPGRRDTTVRQRINTVPS